MIPATIPHLFMIVLKSIGPDLFFLPRLSMSFTDSTTVSTDTTPKASRLNKYVVFSNHSLLNNHSGVFKIKLAHSSYSQLIKCTDISAKWCGISERNSFVFATARLNISIASGMAVSTFESLFLPNISRSIGAFISVALA